MCSPDAVAWIDVAQLGISAVKGLPFASVEIKTSVSASSLDRALQNASEDEMIATVGDGNFVKTILHDHSDQIRQQALVLLIHYIIYVSASETDIIFICVINVPQSIP